MRGQRERGDDLGRWAAWGLGGLAAYWAGRPLLRRAAAGVLYRILRLLLTEPFDANLWEMASPLRRVGPQKIVEVNLRAETGKPLLRPLGPPRQGEDLSGLRFTFAQLDRLPLPGDTAVETGVTIGPQAPRPLRLAIPVLLGGMAVGTALSRRAKLALARGATLAGTACNSGEGAFLPKERELARHWILQYHRGGWAKDPRILAQADMIEIYVGQGAAGGRSETNEKPRHDRELQRLLDLPPGEPAVTEARVPGVEAAEDLKGLVARLREITGGVPIGVKLAAGRCLEADLAWCVEAGVDAVALDGGQAGTAGSPPTLQEDFGLPTLYALVRAARFWEARGLRGRVTLLAGGGLVSPGDFLKCLALGADAVYVGTAAILAIAHGQAIKALPWEPPTQSIFRHGAFARTLNEERAARALANYLTSCVREMEDAARVLGKRALREVGRDDLVALSPELAAACGVPVAWEPQPPAGPPAGAGRPRTRRVTAPST